MGMHMLHEKATDIQQVSRQTRKQDTNIVSLKVLLEWVYDWPVVYWLQLIISKQSFRNSVTGSVFCFEIVNVLDRWMCKGVFDGYPQSKLVYVYFFWCPQCGYREKGTKGRKGEKRDRDTRKKGRQGRGEGVSPHLEAFAPTMLICQQMQPGRRSPGGRPTPFRFYIFNSPNGVRFPMVIS